MAEYVDLSERVTATYYDDEHEEWSQKTVTIADVLDSVCDDYTVLPSAQIERKRGEWIDDYDPVNFGEFRYKCSECGARTVEWADNFCYRCGADMRGEKNGDIY